MKKILLTILGFIGLFSAAYVNGQTATFSIQTPTVADTVLKTAGPTDNITNITGNNLVLKWHVATPTDFPADWLTATAFGICDAIICHNNSSGTLWNESTSSGNSYYSTYYSNSAHDSVESFSLSLDLSAATTLGTHTVTVCITDTASGYTKCIPFTVSKLVSTVGVNTVVPANTNDIVLYPNPARDQLNVVYDVNADVKNIAVYNIIGKMMSVYKVNGGSANLNLQNIPSGIYFVRLYNSVGNVVVTRKFTKE